MELRKRVVQEEFHLKQVRALAKIILEQRSDVEEFFVEALFQLQKTPESSIINVCYYITLNSSISQTSL
jgi:hypothetical protein